MQGVELVAGEEGEDAVEARDFVEEEGEDDEFGGGAEGDEVEEGLRERVSVLLMYAGDVMGGLTEGRGKCRCRAIVLCRTGCVE